MEISMRGIVKNFGKIVANNHIDLDLYPGEIHCLLGENGAGKSTLMHVLYGLYRADQGDIFINSERVRFRSPQDAIHLGIGMIAQHFNLIPRMTVKENITLGKMPRQERLGFLWDGKRAAEIVRELGETTGMVVDPDATVSELSVGVQQRVEVLKAIYLGAKVLILDEPTAVLAPQEVAELFAFMRRMAAQGDSLIIITHRLEEAMMCDRVTVLSAGGVVFRSMVADLTKEQLNRKMFEVCIREDGRECQAEAMTLPPVEAAKDSDCGEGNVLFQVSDLCVQGPTRASTLKDVSLEVNRGEIVGIAGVAGNGQAVFFNALTGLIPLQTGKIRLKGADRSGDTPKQRREAGISFISEDRKYLGLLLDMSLADNIILGYEDKPPFAKGKRLNYKRIKQFARGQIANFEIKAPTEEMRVGQLSGGNQQKVILARELSQGPDLIIVSQPTRGLDVRTTQFVRELLRENRDKGRGVLLISYDLEEILQTADRIAVFFEGRLWFVPRDASVEEIGRYMATGGKAGEAVAN